MARFNIHWRGCPHHHLPRIRLASSHHSGHHSRSQAHAAAVEVVQLPFGPDFDKARLQQRMRTRARRRKRSSGVPSLGIIASRRASRTAHANAWGHGQNVTEETQIQNHRTDRNYHGPQPKYPNLSSLTPPTEGPVLAIPDHDVSLPARDSQDHPLHSLEASQYRPSRKSGGPGIEGSLKNAFTGRVGGDYNRLEPVDVDRECGIEARRPIRNISRIYDSRVPVKRPSHRTSSKSFHHRLPHHHQQLPSISLQPSLGKSECSTGSLSHAAGIRVPHTSLSNTVSNISTQIDLPSRTPSQVVALKNFSRELERHLIVQDTLRNACLSHLSPSSSSLSAVTVVEFLPYLAEFQAAGLAVTSAEQGSRSHYRSKGQPVLENAQRVFEHERFAPGKAVQSRNDAHLTPNFDTSSQSDGVSANTTVITFSSPIPQRVMALKSGNKTTRNVLPWLRRADDRVDFSKLTDLVDKEAARDVTATPPSICGTSTTTIVDFSEPKVANFKKSRKYLSALRGQPTDGKWTDIDGESPLRKAILVAEQSCNSEIHNSPQYTPQHDGTNSRNGGTWKTSFNKPLIRSPCNLDLASNPEAMFGGDLKNHCHPFTKSIAGVLLPEAATTSSSPCQFRCSPVLMQQQQPTLPEDSQFAKVATDIAISGATSCRSTFPLPPDRKHHSPPSSNARQTPPWTFEFADTSLPGLYDNERHSIFEQALKDIEGSTQGKQFRDSRAVGDQPVSSKKYRRSGDPIKKKTGPSSMSRKHAAGRANMAGIPSLHSTATDTTGTSARPRQLEGRNPDILEGLKVAMAAARKKEADSRITEMSKYIARRFLADLRVFEGLGANVLSDEAVRTAKKRKRELNTRAMSHGRVNANQKDNLRSRLKPGVVATHPKETAMNENGARRGLIVDEMLGRRQARARDRVRERALEMGWIAKSVSTGF